MLQYSFGIETKVDPSTWSRENLKHDIQESEWSAKIQKQDIVKNTRYPYYINLNSCNFKCRSSKYTSPILNKNSEAHFNSQSDYIEQSTVKLGA